jgi:hypothetical protein
LLCIAKLYSRCPSILKLPSEESEEEGYLMAIDEDQEVQYETVY